MQAAQAVAASKYTLIKRIFIKYPKLREFGASVFLFFPVPLSAYLYRVMRRFVFRDNNIRVNTFHAAFLTLGKGLRKGSRMPDYLEFGVARGTSVISSYHISLEYGLKCRLFAFDSFQGLPSSEGDHFEKGDMAYPVERFLRFVYKAGVPMDRVHTIPGFFEQSLTPELYAKLDLSRGVYCVHIDSDLYESARTVLRWLTPILDSGSVIIFDDWFAFDYKENPEDFGEKRAFREWDDHENWKQLYVEQNWNIAFIIK